MKNWTVQIDQTTAEFVQRFGTLTADELNWKPNPEAWSIAQNVDHIMVINQTYFPILADLKAGRYTAPFIARFGFITSFLGKMVLDAVQADRKKKTKTFSIWEPAESRISGDILQRFANHQEKLKAEIEAAAPFVKAGTVISSPANKYIVYTLETAFDIIVTHERRHLEQSKEVLEALHTQALADVNKGD